MSRYEEDEECEDTTNYAAVYAAALAIWELTHDRDLCENAMYLCARKKIHDAEDWVAERLREKLDYANGISHGRFSCSDTLYEACAWAIRHKYPDIIIGCLRLCKPGALDGLKWGIPPPYRNI